MKALYSGLHPCVAIAKPFPFGHSFPMNQKPSSSGALTSLEDALAALLEGLTPVKPKSVPLAEAIGLVAAEAAEISVPLPDANRAEIDGWAFRATDVVGASAYAPLALTVPPRWVEVGEALPPGCDCVLEPDLVEPTGPYFSVLGEAPPGAGIRRVGADLAVGRSPTLPGVALTALDLALVGSAGLDAIEVREPGIRIIDVSDQAFPGISAQMLAGRLRMEGFRVDSVEICARDEKTILDALHIRPADLVVLVGGTGNGKIDPTATALAAACTWSVHRIAMHPGSTTAAGLVDGAAVIALPGLPGHAFGGYLALVDPVLNRLSGRRQPRRIHLPLARKIASAVGLAELALLRQEDDRWRPLAVGEATLEIMREADAWLIVPANDEGYAQGATIGAIPLR